MERLDLGLNNGWVSFRARFIKLFFFFDFTGKRIPRKFLWGPNACVSLEQPIIQLQTFVRLPRKNLQRANSKLTISKLAQAHERALGRARSHCFRDNEVSRGVTGVLVFLLRCLDYLAYVEEFYKTQITTPMQISRISQYHNVQNGEDTLFKTCRTKYAFAECWNRLLFVKEHSFRYHYLIVLNFMLYYINEHRSWNVVEKYAMQKNRKNDYIFLQ